MIPTKFQLLQALRGEARLQVHEVIRQHSHATTLALKEGAARNDLLDRLKADPSMALVDIIAVVAAGNFAGRAPEQVDEFLAEVVEPALEPYRGALGQRAELHV